MPVPTIDSLSKVDGTTVVECPALLIIGYGNELRGDDAAGPQIAKAVAAWELPEVRALAVHQLTPELAEALAHAHHAIFVDAQRIDAAAADVALHPIAPLDRPHLAGHVGDPGALLALANAVYGQYPRAFLIAVPASSFQYGAGLSHVASAGVASALRLIRYLITLLRVEPGTTLD
jgi:hydrogenase maturation protease